MVVVCGKGTYTADGIQAIAESLHVNNTLKILDLYNKHAARVEPARGTWIGCLLTATRALAVASAPPAALSWRS